MARLDIIRKMVDASPDDPFPRYGLAMELRALGQLEEAAAAFVDLERRFPDYVPQYLMHHQLLAQIGRFPEGRTVLERGIAVATRRGDGHATGEMQAALEAIGDE